MVRLTLPDEEQRFELTIRVLWLEHTNGTG